MFFITACAQNPYVDSSSDKRTRHKTDISLANKTLERVLILTTKDKAINNGTLIANLPAEGLYHPAIK